MPDVWVQVTNDAFGGTVLHNDDDFRTNAFSGAARLGGHLVAAVDYSMLTDKKGRSGGSPTRSDELTATVGMVLVESAPDDRRQVWAVGGFGVRIAGDLGGAGLQNRWHHLTGFAPVDMPYADDGSRRVDGVLCLHGSAMESREWTRPPRWLSSWLLDSAHLAAIAEGTGLGTTGGEFQWLLGAKLALLGRRGGLWTGLQYRARGGVAASPAASATADDEAGPWAIFGGSAGSFCFESGFKVGDSGTNGRVGLIFRSGDVVHVHQTRTVVGELGGTATSYGIGVQWRWCPTWLRDTAWLGSRATLLADYRFGKVPGVDLRDNSLRYNQGLVGLDVGAWEYPQGAVGPWLGWQPFAYTGLGYRIEGFQAEGDDPEMDAQRDQTAVIQGGIGLRLSLFGTPSTAGGSRFGISVSGDGWLPVGRATAYGDEGAVPYLRPGWGISARLTWTVAW